MGATGTANASDDEFSVNGMRYDSYSAYLQSDEFRNSGGRCGFDFIKEKFRYRYDEEKAASDCSLFRSANLGDYFPDAVYTIPVWVHVIRADDGVTGELSDALINSQIDVLNEDFRAITNTPGGSGNDAQIEFRLAGVSRYNNSVWFYSGDEIYTYMSSMAKDPQRYLNIYTKELGNLLGIATLPSESAGQSDDGVMINYHHFGRNTPGAAPYDQGRTTTHEVGHYLGLDHPWGIYGGCPSSDSPYCYSNGDFICDTNPQSGEIYGCPFQPESCGSPDPITNYMNYTDDGCMDLFSIEQIYRMRCSLENYRPNLYEVSADPTPTPTPTPTPAPTPTPIPCADGLTPVYRLYSESLMVHLFTTDENEKNVLGAGPVWRYEGIAWYVFPDYRNGAVPVFRLYSDALKIHLYTTDANEKNVLDATSVWHYEMVAWYVFPTYQDGAAPIYRMYSDGLKKHLYTRDDNEKNILNATPVWVYEMIAYYAYSTCD
jgi:hypothetical protein